MRRFFPIMVLLVVSIAIVPAYAQTITRINPPGLSTPRTYTHVVKAGDLLFIAGQVAVDEKGNVVGQTMAEQLERALSNLEIALRSQGASMGHVVKTTIYTTSVADFSAADAAAVRAKHMAGNFPASTLVQIQQLARPEFKVEIEAIAVAPHR